MKKGGRTYNNQPQILVEHIPAYRSVQEDFIHVVLHICKMELVAPSGQEAQLAVLLD